MFPLLEGIKILEYAQNDSARYCGRLLAELGAEVSRIQSAEDVEDTTQEHIDAREVFNQYLDQYKVITSKNAFDDKQQLIDLAKEAELCIFGYESVDFPQVIDMIIANGTSVLTITPFGITGLKAKELGGDLIASHSSGYAHHLAFPTTSALDNPPRRGPEGQALMFAGMLGATAAIGALIGHGNGQRATLLDLTEQEASATLLFEELAAYNDGHLPTARQVDGSAESSAVAGGLVGILPCANGFVAVSPREQHQWRRVVEWLGYPLWAELDQFSTPSLRMENWSELQKYLSDITSSLQKEIVFQELQAKKVACFPINQLEDIFSIEQLESRGYWQSFSSTAGSSVTIPGLPFKYKQAKKSSIQR
jgi:crotonobetainyl-CoA:carnitine CoA-transferase CaiB-like acyl-CoA transferase